MDAALFNKAKKYYEYAILESLRGLTDNYIQIGNAVASVKEQYLENAGSSERPTHNAFIHYVIQEMISTGLIKEVSNDFAPPFIRLDPAIRSAPTKNEISKSIEQLGTSGGDWFRAALLAIPKHFESRDIFDAYQQLIAKKALTGHSSNEETLSPPTEDTWEPVKIDRTTAEYSEAIEASEAALREVESSNGYAATDPDERNGIVATVRGTLEAIKNGMPTKPTILHGLLAPLKFVSKKFADTTIGEIVKIAITKIITWLSGF